MAQYAHDIRDEKLGKMYQVTTRTIKNWRQIGKLAKQAAPFESALSMCDWWSKMRALGKIKRDLPVGLRLAADAESGTESMAVKTKPGTSKASSMGDGPNAEMDALLAGIESGGSFDYGDGVKIAQRNIQVCDLLLIQAIKAGRVREIGPLRKQLSEAGDAYRALMKDRGKIQAEAGETLPKAEVREAMLELHGNITKRFRQSLKLSYGQLEENAKTPEEWARFIDNLVDSICRILKESDFAAK